MCVFHNSNSQSYCLCHACVMLIIQATEQWVLRSIHYYAYLYICSTPYIVNTCLITAVQYGFEFGSFQVIMVSRRKQCQYRDSTVLCLVVSWWTIAPRLNICWKNTGIEEDSDLRHFIRIPKFASALSEQNSILTCPKCNDYPQIHRYGHGIKSK